MMSSISLASSKIRRSRLPLLWSPAKAWGLVFDHGIMSIRQVRSREGSLERREVAFNSKCWRMIGLRWLNHFRSEGLGVGLRPWDHVDPPSAFSGGILGKEGGGLQFKVLADDWAQVVEPLPI